MKEKDYEALVRAIFEKHPSVQVTGFGPRSYKAGLDAQRAFDEVLGHPWRQYRCIHVAGTNGKGSVCSIMAAQLASRGWRVGLYTSPHLLDFRERIKIVERPSDGSGNWWRMIPKDDVWNFLTSHSADIEPLSFFEITTGLAFEWFAEQNVDFAIIEVGLGGRLDSTNIITPVLSIVTGIGLDHCALLGNTRTAIAAEKAGIFKPGVPALVWGHDEETDLVFRHAAEAAGADLHFAEPETNLPAGMDLKGDCQRINVGTVSAAMSLLGLETDCNAIRHTAEMTGFHGRWEIISRNPVTIADIGHNPAALAINFRQLAESGKPLYIIYGIMSDKDLAGIAPLMPSGAEYFLCAPDTPRALPAAELHSRLSDLRPDLSLHLCSSVKAALASARSAAPPDSIIYIGGSTFVVAEAL